MATITLYDAVNALDLPSDALAVAGYVDGRWPSLGAARRRFPHAMWLSIATSAASSAMVLDVELGDATLPDALEWVRRMHGEGTARPALYLSASRIPDLDALLPERNLERNQLRLWSAHWNGRPHICSPACGWPMKEPPGCTQYATNAQRGFDTSQTSTQWLSIVRADYLRNHAS